jgi:hypothetical protein
LDPKIKIAAKNQLEIALPETIRNLLMQIFEIQSHLIPAFKRFQTMELYAYYSAMPLSYPKVATQQ